MLEEENDVRKIGVPTRGDEAPWDEGCGRKGVLHAERMFSRLLVDEEMLELIEGKCSKEDDVLRATSGKDLVPVAEPGRAVGILSGLIVAPASIGSGTKTGDTCTFSFVKGRAARG
jgi:hypothetical protein